MRGLEARELLELHERGRGLAPARRALLLLERAEPDASVEGLATLPVGRRDARILELRERTLGGVIQTETACPACGERLELDLRSEELRGVVEEGPPAPGGGGGTQSPAGGSMAGSAEASSSAAHVRLARDGWQLILRLPGTRDLLAVLESGGTEADLLARCLVEVRRDGEAVDPSRLPDDLPAGVRQAAQEAMAEADPLADLRLALTCPECAHAWSAPFDPSGFFWGEIEAWVPRLLREVHLLASAYGWSEADILAMDAWRRGQYLSLLGA